MYLCLFMNGYTRRSLFTKMETSTAVLDLVVSFIYRWCFIKMCCMTWFFVEVKTEWKKVTYVEVSILNE